MTPERLQEIALWHAENVAADIAYPGAQTDETRMVGELLRYIDLLHEDLRITRAERDTEKKKLMQMSKDHAAEVLKWDELVSLKNERIDALIQQVRNQADEIQELRKDTK